MTWDALLELRRCGQIATEFPRLRQLLADLTDAELGRAGQLLSQLDPDDVLREHPATPTARVAITGHGTLAPLLPALTAEHARHGILLRPYLSDFGNYVFELSDPGSSLYGHDPDLTLCLLDPMMIFDEVPVPWQPADVERVAAEKLGLLDGLITHFENFSRGTVVLNTMPLLRRFCGQLVDLRSRAMLGAVWRDANARLLRLSHDHPAVIVVDLEPITADGVAAQDARLSVYAKAHLTPALLARYAREVAHLTRHLVGRTSKCLVTDLDNTLWGGVAGEDGVDGIEVGDSYRGDAFRIFQGVVKQIGSQGVLLAAVSKSDPEPARLALREHPRMIVREEDFVAVTANWRPKQENLAELAEALNIGADSLVFADDSAYECGLVRHTLPGTAVVRLDDEPALNVGKLLADGWFDVLELTAEDKARASMYRAEFERKGFLDSFESIEDYLAELGVTVRLATASEHDVQRVSQLTLRTNQFNMTVERLQPADVTGLIADPAAGVLTIRAGDRFGDNGLVGAIFTSNDGSVLHLDNFLLSCRVFARGIEQACLAAVLRHASAAGVRAVLGSYRPAAKNAKVADFYQRHGFVPVSRNDTFTTFRHDLVAIPAMPGHVSMTVSFSEDAT